jgi:hypothetical protein
MSKKRKFIDRIIDNKSEKEHLLRHYFLERVVERVFIETCSNCQNNCEECAHKDMMKYYPGFNLSIDELKRFIYYTKKSNYFIKQAWLHGPGEPTLWSNLDEGLKILKDSECIGDIFLWSNGETIEKIDEKTWENIDAMHISLYPFCKNKKNIIEIKNRYPDKIFINDSIVFEPLPQKKDKLKLIPCKCCTPGPMFIKDKIFLHCGPTVFRAADLMGINIFDYDDMFSDLKENYLDKIEDDTCFNRNFEICKYCHANDNINFKEKIAQRKIPPRFPPKKLLNRFTMKGKIPMALWFLDDTQIKSTFFLKKDIDELIKKAMRKEINYYGHVDTCLYEALEDFPIREKKVAIMGSVIPWYESICLAYGGIPTTIEYNRITTDDDRLKVMTVEEYDKNPIQLDMAFSISSFEHDGLGRYGDPIDPNGDLKAMKKMKKIIRKNGIMFLNVPCGGEDGLVWNAHRIYGPIRFPLLIEGWEILKKYKCENEYLWVLKNAQR